MSKTAMKRELVVQNLSTKRNDLYNSYASECWRLLLFIIFTVGVEFELAIAVIVAPPLVFSTGTAGGFRRLVGAGGADLR